MHLASIINNNNNIPIPNILYPEGLPVPRVKKIIIIRRFI